MAGKSGFEDGDQVMVRRRYLVLLFPLLGLMLAVFAFSRLIDGDGDDLNETISWDEPEAELSEAVVWSWPDGSIDLSSNLSGSVEENAEEVASEVAVVPSGEERSDGVQPHSSDEQQDQIFSPPAAGNEQTGEEEEIDTSPPAGAEEQVPDSMATLLPEQNALQQVLLADRELVQFQVSPGGSYRLALTRQQRTLPGLSNRDEGRSGSAWQNLLIPSAEANEQSDVVAEVPAEDELLLFNDQGELVATVATGALRGADFIDDASLVYQQLDQHSVADEDGLFEAWQEIAGVYRYDIGTATPLLLQATTDGRTLDGVEPLHFDRYFYTAPATGELGWLQVEDAAGTWSVDRSVVGEKIVPNDSNFAREGAYRFPTLSPDGKWIAGYDRTFDLSGQPTVAIWSVENMEAEPSLRFPADLVARNLNVGEPLLHWSSDGRLLIAGDQGRVIEVAEARLLFSAAEGEVANHAFSPNDQWVLSHRLLSGELAVFDVAGNEQAVLSQRVGQAKWLNEELILLVIGERLYVWDVVEDALTSVGTTRAAYRIMETFEGTAWVLMDGEMWLVGVR